MSFNSFNTTLDYPLFGLNYIDDNTFVVSGGGGEGRHGIPNEIAIFRIVNKLEGDSGKDDDIEDKKAAENGQPKVPKLLKEKQLKLISKYTFDKNSTDAPMSLAYVDNQSLYIGINDAKNLIESSKKNNNLKSFKISEHLADINPVSQTQLFNSLDPQVYIKKIAISEQQAANMDPYAVLVTSDTKSQIYINTLSQLNLRSSIFQHTEDVEIKDVAINNYVEVSEISYVTRSLLKIIKLGQASSKTEVLETKFDKFVGPDFQLLRVIYISSTQVLVLGAITKAKQVIAAVFSVTDKNELKLQLSQVVAKNVRSVNAIDFKHYLKDHNKNHGLLAVATSDLSIILYHVNLDGAQAKPKIFKLYEFKQVHAFALTNLKISPKLKSLISISAANTINTIEFPSNEDDLIKLKNSNSLISVILFLLVLLLAIVFAQGR